MPDAKKILLLSAYRSDSHACWTDWLMRSITGVDWQLLELPGRHFRWRIRGNPVSWSEQLAHSSPDLVLASSMVDLATIKGLHPQLSDVPAIYYFHENQFAYPESENQLRSLEPKMVQLYAAMCAQKLVFNSAWNRDSFLQGVDQLLALMPDQVPAGIVDRMAQKCSLLPVPVPVPVPIPVPVSGSDSNSGLPTIDLTESVAGAKQQNTSPLILWNHRWEYDKAPQVFAEAILRLQTAGVDFRLALLGARPAKGHDALRRLEQSCGDRIIANGKLARDDYVNMLCRSSIVVSTAIHEFQGLSVLEAVLAGAVPLVPDALSYREQFSAAYRYTPADSSELAERLQQFIQNMPAMPDVTAYSEASLKPAWQEMLS